MLILARPLARSPATATTQMNSFNLVTTEIEQNVLRFVAEETGCSAKRLTLTSRLAHDVGADGDDAVDLFEKFEKKYDVDLTLLYQHWDEHFSPEGGGPGLGFMAATGMALMAGDFLNRAYRPIPSWAWMIALLAAFLVVHAKYFSEPVKAAPITVQELVDAAISHRWARRYEPREEMFRSVE